MEKKLFLQMKEVEDEHWWFVGRRNILIGALSSLQLPEQSDILDAGCGTGGNLQALSKFGEVVGVELDEAAAPIAAGRQIGRVCRARLPNEVPFPEQTFDLIVLMDVLEHLDEDLSTLRTIKSLLKVNGYLILTVPAFQFLWSRHDEEHHHKRRYNRSTLMRNIQEVGLKVEHLTYYNVFLFPVIAIVRLLKRFILLKEMVNELRIPHPWLNRILQAIFSSERHIVRRAYFPFGVSLLAIVKRVEAN